MSEVDPIKLAHTLAAYARVNIMLIKLLHKAELIDKNRLAHQLKKLAENTSQKERAFVFLAHADALLDANGEMGVPPIAKH